MPFLAQDSSTRDIVLLFASHNEERPVLPVPQRQRTRNLLLCAAIVHVTCNDDGDVDADVEEDAQNDARGPRVVRRCGVQATDGQSLRTHYPSSIIHRSGLW